MLSLKGKATCKFKSFIGIVTREPKRLFERKDCILVSDNIGINSIGYLGAITKSQIKDCFYLPFCICNIATIDMLQTGDIVRMSSDGEIFVLWKKNSNQNVLLLTEACNCKCLMCPQPPKKHDQELVTSAQRILNLLKKEKTENICISGGEPTILKDDFINILLRCVQEHPESKIDILTNGKKLADKEYANTVASISTDQVIFCVSLHSDISEIHDKIVGASGSYSKTINGIYNLAENNCSIEIRIVVNKLNYKDLPRIALHLSNYLPFCVHYAFMGMEIHGLAAKNFHEININPSEYVDSLREAVLSMNRRGLNVSVYNVPLCMCHEDIWAFAKQSISQWKNVYMEECSKCKIKSMCCGFFETSQRHPVDHIKPFTNEIKQKFFVDI